MTNVNSPIMFRQAYYCGSSRAFDRVSDFGIGKLASEPMVQQVLPANVIQSKDASADDVSVP